MDDLIRRQDAISVLNAKCKKAFNITCGEEDCACAEYMALRDLPSARQWIPCSEMLPMDKGVYLVTDDSGRVAWVEKSWFMWCDDGSPFWEYANVTAWMPLPEPYKGEEK